jgi:beta-glucanase (GH16 family)
MKDRLTIKELFETTLNGQDIDVITVHYPFGKVQYDNGESIPFQAVIIEDYEIEYDADEGMVYVDIYVGV